MIKNNKKKSVKVTVFSLTPNAFRVEVAGIPQRYISFVAWKRLMNVNSEDDVE
jgi:hypothetical protein